MQRESTHSIQSQHRYEARSSESFDRLAYAMELLAILKPRMNVAVYQRIRHLEVQRGGRETGAWAILGIPPHATREAIARALAELSDLHREPFLVDLLCARSLAPAAE